MTNVPVNAVLNYLTEVMEKPNYRSMVEVFPAIDEIFKQAFSITECTGSHSTLTAIDGFVTADPTGLAIVWIDRMDLDEPMTPWNRLRKLMGWDVPYWVCECLQKSDSTTLMFFYGTSLREGCRLERVIRVCGRADIDIKKMVMRWDVLVSYDYLRDRTLKRMWRDSLNSENPSWFNAVFSRYLFLFIVSNPKEAKDTVNQHICRHGLAHLADCIGVAGSMTAFSVALDRMLTAGWADKQLPNTPAETIVLSENYEAWPLVHLGDWLDVYLRWFTTRPFNCMGGLLKACEVGRGTLWMLRKDTPIAVGWVPTIKQAVGQRVFQPYFVDQNNLPAWKSSSMHSTLRHRLFTHPTAANAMKMLPVVREGEELDDPAFELDNTGLLFALENYLQPFKYFSIRLLRGELKQIDRYELMRGYIQEINGIDINDLKRGWPGLLETDRKHPF